MVAFVSSFKKKIGNVSLVREDTFITELGGVLRLLEKYFTVVVGKSKKITLFEKKKGIYLKIRDKIITTFSFPRKEWFLSLGDYKMTFSSSLQKQTIDLMGVPHFYSAKKIDDFGFEIELYRK